MINSEKDIRLDKMYKELEDLEEELLSSSIYKKPYIFEEMVKLEMEIDIITKED
jgi:hypothetical protein